MDDDDFNIISQESLTLNVDERYELIEDFWGVLQDNFNMTEAPWNGATTRALKAN